MTFPGRAYDAWKTTNPDDQFLGPEPHIPELWEQLAEFLEEVQRKEEIQKDVEQTLVWAEREIEHLVELKAYTAIRQLAANAVLKTLHD